MFRAQRPLFTAALAGQVRALGIPIRYGVRVVDYLEDETHAEVVLADLVVGNERIKADVVVAADGVGTKSHRLINGHDVRALSSNRSIFRTSYDVKYVLEDPELAERFGLEEGGEPTFELWTGTDLAFTVLRAPGVMQWSINHKVRGKAERK